MTGGAPGASALDALVVAAEPVPKPHPLARDTYQFHQSSLDRTSLGVQPGRLSA